MDKKEGRALDPERSCDYSQRFDQAVYLIAAGLVKKEELCEADPGKYPYSSTFRHGLNMYCALAAECATDPADFLRGFSESAFIRAFATADVRTWVACWRPEAVAALAGCKYLSVGPLAELDGDFVGLTHECYEIQRLAEDDLIGGYQERSLYEYLRESSQSLYVLGRRLLIRHPILSWDDYIKIKTGRFDLAADPLDQGESAGVDCGWLAKLLERAYEPSPDGLKVCPTCGWTMSGRGLQPYRITLECSKVLPADRSCLQDVEHGSFRLLRGVMHYISAPGGLELAVAEEALRLGMSFELWPEKDTADVLITAPDGRRIAVDAKTYGRAERLAQEVREDRGIARLGADEVMYVVPDEAERKQRGYCLVCNEALKDRKGYSCCTLKEFVRRLRRMKVGEL